MLVWFSALSSSLTFRNSLRQRVLWYFFFFSRLYNRGSACSTVVENSQQESFTECRCQRHVKPPTWRRTKDLERSNCRHKRPPASEATLANPTAEVGTMGEKWPRNSLPRHFWVLLHVVKHDMGQTKEGVLRIFFARKIWRLRPGLNPRTWVPKASTLPLDHRSRCLMIYSNIKYMYLRFYYLGLLTPWRGRQKCPPQRQ
jgi:hypothetical protein